MSSGSDPRSKIFNTTTAPASSPVPATSGHIGIVLARCTPPALAIDANGPSRTSLTAGPIIARIPQTIPAAAPITIKLGVKCAAMVPPEPANMDCPNRSTRYVPSRKPLGTPNSPPRTPTTAPSQSIPLNNPTGLAPIAPMVPITARRSSTANRIVFTAMRQPTRTPASAIRLKLCVLFSNTAGWCGRGGPAVATPAMTRSTSAVISAPGLGQDERGRRVTGRGEHARGDVRGRG